MREGSCWVVGNRQDMYHGVAWHEHGANANARGDKFGLIELFVAPADFQIPAIGKTLFKCRQLCRQGFAWNDNAGVPPVTDDEYHFCPIQRGLSCGLNCTRLSCALGEPNDEKNGDGEVGPDRRHRREGYQLPAGAGTSKYTVGRKLRKNTKNHLLMRIVLIRGVALPRGSSR